MFVYSFTKFGECICAMFKLDTPAELSGQLTQSSLGESVILDDVYDSTTDHFTGQSVITGSTQPLTVTGTLVKNFCQRGSITAASYATLVLLQQRCVCVCVICLLHSGIVSKRTFTDGEPKDSSFCRY